MSYTKIWLHTVWSTKNRVISISNSFRPLLLNHFREQSKEKEIQLDFINAPKNHIHALINLGRKQSVSEVMRLLKGESSFWINKMKIMPDKFSWQDDYFAVSVSHSHLERVRKYIQNQDEHHRKMSWEEVNLFLKNYSFEKIKDRRPGMIAKITYLSQFKPPTKEMVMDFSCLFSKTKTKATREGSPDF